MALTNDHFKDGILKEVPFDCCCPSLNDILVFRTCECGIYHGSKKAFQYIDEHVLFVQNRQMQFKQKNKLHKMPTVANADHRYHSDYRLGCLHEKLVEGVVIVPHTITTFL